MTATTSETAGVMVTLTEEERAQLVTLLEQATKDTAVEAHRTDSPDFREHIQRRETVFRGLMEKLRRP